MSRLPSDCFRLHSIYVGLVVALAIGPVARGAGPTEKNLREDDTNKQPVKKRGQSSGRPNLCLHSDYIVVGQVENATSRWESRPMEGGAIIVTDLDFRVERVVLGSIEQGDVLFLYTRGGRLDGLRYFESGYPRLHEGQWYTLFLEQREGSKHLLFDAYRRIPDDLVVDIPPEDVLRAIWDSTCRANPEGIYFGVPFTLVLPPGVAPAEGRFLVGAAGPARVVQGGQLNEKGKASSSSRDESDGGQ